MAKKVNCWDPYREKAEGNQQRSLEQDRPPSSGTSRDYPAREYAPSGVEVLQTRNGLMI